MSKRILDLAGALLALVVSLPILLVVAVAIKLDSAGPVFFIQPRVGRGGRLFRFYKFRSMIIRPESGPVITVGEDPRITRIGRLIRPLRIDELPQLINVLKGEMSLVGPRPEAPSVVERYTAEQRQVLEVAPGITGPTQLAWLNERASLPPGGDPAQYYITHILPQKLQSDLRYVRTRTLASDLASLLVTPLRLAHHVFAGPRLSRALKAWRLLIDLTAVAIAIWLAFLARFDGEISALTVRTMLLGLPIVLLAYGASYVCFTTYRGIWRYAGVEDFWQLVKACLLGGCLTAAAMRLAAWPYPRTALVLAPVLTLLIMAGARLACRTAATALDRTAWLSDRRRVVIIGAGKTGEAIARELLGSPQLGYRVVGFVDDNPRLQRSMLHNVPVLGTTRQLQDLVRQHTLDEAIIAIPRLGLGAQRRIGRACTAAGLEFKTLPSMSQLVQGEGQLRYLRKVNLGELLRRDTLSVAPDRIASFLRDRRVLVTGAGGSIGSELCRQIVKLGADSLLMVDRAENGLFEICMELQAAHPRMQLSAALADVKHVPRMSELFDAFKPNLIFHAAAYKHVPILESHPPEAVLNNVVGTVRLAQLARARGVERFVFISTDKAVKPSNLMGASKRICELYLMALNRGPQGRHGDAGAMQFRVVRFGNVLGSAGSALPLFQRQIETGSAITITDPEVSRFFMTIQEAVALVLESAAQETEEGITVLDMGKPVRITTLADDLVMALGLPPSVVPKRVIGLRPGEKMHELLWEDGDDVVASPNPRIVTVRQASRPFEEMEAYVGQLERLAIAGDVARLLAKVQEMVPTYQACPDNGPTSLVLDTSAPPEDLTLPTKTNGPAVVASSLKPAVNPAP